MPTYQEERQIANGNAKIALWMSPETVTALKVHAAENDTSVARVIEWLTAKVILGTPRVRLQPPLQRGRKLGSGDTVPRKPYAPRKPKAEPA